MSYNALCAWKSSYIIYFRNVENNRCLIEEELLKALTHTDNRNVGVLSDESDCGWIQDADNDSAVITAEDNEENESTDFVNNC